MKYKQIKNKENFDCLLSDGVYFYDSHTNFYELLSDLYCFEIRCLQKIIVRDYSNNFVKSFIYGDARGYVSLFGEFYA